MTCLIEGWFQLANPRQFTDNSPEATTTSPRKPKQYLTIYDSCAALGSLASKAFINTEVRLYNANQDINDKVIHLWGKFSVVSVDNEKGPHLQVDAHHFVVNTLDPRGDFLPEALRISVIVFGRVTSVAEVAGSPDKFLVLEASDWVRDRNQTFNIRCRLNRTTSKRWEKTHIPTPGMSILISGSLEGEDFESLRVDLETMQFITPTRGVETAGLPATPGRSKFGIPIRAKAKENTSSSDTPSSSPFLTQDSQSPRPLSMLPIPTLPPSEAEAGPSTPGPPKRTRAAAKKKGNVATATSSELTTADEGDGSPVAKKKQKGKAKEVQL